jgi:hypothetical protein
MSALAMVRTLIATSGLAISAKAYSNSGAALSIVMTGSVYRSSPLMSFGKKNYFSNLASCLLKIV